MQVYIEQVQQFTSTQFIPMLKIFWTLIKQFPGYTIGLYILYMFMYRVYCERRTRISAPIPKGQKVHDAIVAKVEEEFQSYLKARKPGQMVTIQRSRGGESDSNRTVAQSYKENACRVNVSELDGVVSIDTKAMLITVEPSLPQDTLARFCIAYGVIPKLVLEFPGITVGGAICGGGIESSSHAVGAFHDTVEHFDILTGDGRTLRKVSRTNHPDLFWAVRTSFGTFGILLSVTLRLEKAPKYIHVRYAHAKSPRDGCKVLVAASEIARKSATAHETSEFIDGLALSETSAIAVLGRGVDEPPTGVKFRSLRGSRSDPWFFWHLASLAARFPARSASEIIGRNGVIKTEAEEEYMPLEDYLFRFDRGAFWMARYVFFFVNVFIRCFYFLHFFFFLYL
jgi:Delta24-sterol reductase